jgi:hypothetical protein
MRSTIRNALGHFYNYGVPVFLIGGTFLGAYRNCDVNANDHDLDVGIFLDDLLRLDRYVMHAVWKDIQSASLKPKKWPGWMCNNGNPQQAYAHLATKDSTTDFAVDISVFHRQANVSRPGFMTGFQKNMTVWRRNTWGMTFVESDFELAWMHFLGIHALVPSQKPVDKIRELYGTLWNQPTVYDKYWGLEKGQDMATLFAKVSSPSRNATERGAHAKTYGINTVPLRDNEVGDDKTWSSCEKQALSCSQWY